MQIDARESVAQTILSVSKMTKSRTAPEYPPGSPEAVLRGCICATAENNFGRGRYIDGRFQPHFVADTECPIHGFQALFGFTEEDLQPPQK